MNVRIRSKPRPLTFSRLAGSVGSGSFDGSKPGPSSRTTKVPDTREMASCTCRRRLCQGSAEGPGAGVGARGSTPTFPGFEGRPRERVRRELEKIPEKRAQRGRVKQRLNTHHH